MLSANTLGRYHIIREIARSNDIVYEATDPASGKKIALKELQVPPNLAGQARLDRIQRFTREARAAARLSHPNVVRILDHGQVQSRYYIAMEFLEGQSLREILRQRGGLPLQEAVRIALAVADGLEYAHGRGVVHRDIKPDNVHLEPDGRIVITDFGIARLTFEPSLTADGQIFGTPSYMSPEQVAGKGIDRRSDIFSLGVMLYEMIAGRKPFAGDSVITITYNIMNMEPPPLVGAPPAVDQVIRRAMAKDPARRFQSAAEFAAALRQAAAGTAPAPLAYRPAVAPSNGGTGSRSPVPSSPPPRGPVPARPMPQPILGNGSGSPRPGAYRRPAGGGPSPGARPLPQSSASRPVPAPSPGPAAYPGYPAPAAGPGNAASPSGSTDLKWLLGWLGVAVVAGLLIMTLVWFGVTAYDRFDRASELVAADGLQTAADAAFREARYEEALRGYLDAAAKATGERKAVALKNASVAAVELARRQLDGGDAGASERYARRALQLDPDSAPAFVALGRALAQQGRIDESLTAFDEGIRREAAPARSGSEARLWKAATLYAQGEKLVATDPALAKQRFEQTVEAAPSSAFARNARIFLAQLGGRQAPPGGLPGMPGAGPSGSGPDGPPEPPPGWMPGYQLDPPSGGLPGR